MLRTEREDSCCRCERHAQSGARESEWVGMCVGKKRSKKGRKQQECGFCYRVREGDASCSRRRRATLLSLSPSLFPVPREMQCAASHWRLTAEELSFPALAVTITRSRALLVTATNAHTALHRLQCTHTLSLTSGGLEARLDRSDCMDAKRNTARGRGSSAPGERRLP